MIKPVLGVVGAVLLLVGCGGMPGDMEEEIYGSDGSPLSTQAKTLLNSVKMASDKYHNVNIALADGFQPLSDCVKSPMGGMGYHYVNFNRAFGAPLSELNFTALLYEDDPKSVGGRGLVGVEYISFVFQDGAPFIGNSPDAVPAPRPDSIQTPPRLFNGEASLDGPMPGHGPGSPWHFDLHAYVWRGSSGSVFAEWNKNVHCN